MLKGRLKDAATRLAMRLIGSTINPQRQSPAQTTAPLLQQPYLTMDLLHPVATFRF